MRPAIKPKNVLSDKIPRILADVLSLSTGISLGFLAYFMGFVVLWNRTPNSGQILDVFRVQCFQNILLSIFVGLIIFELFGFYAHTRTYQNKYKFLVIINAVTVTFAAEVLLYSYVLRLGAVPRGVMLLAWLFSLVLIAGCRAIKMYVTTSYSIEKKVVGEKKEIHNVLVIGGAGYIGSVLTRQLLAKGYKVRVMDSLFFGDDCVRELRTIPVSNCFAKTFATWNRW